MLYVHLPDKAHKRTEREREREREREIVAFILVRKKTRLFMSHLLSLTLRIRSLR